MIRFFWLSGDVNYRQYGGTWISQKLNNGEFNYYFMLELINWWDTVDEDQPQYLVTLSAVSPEQARKENIEAAKNCCGFKTIIDDKQLVYALYAYGISVPVITKRGSNYKKLLKEVKQKAQFVESLFGFYMDRPVNAIGTTGWELLQGDLTSAMNRLQNVN